MLGKLMKYELRSMLRLFFPLWAGIILLSFVNRFVLHSTAARLAFGGIPAIALTVIYVIAIIAAIAIALVVTIRRFYVGLLRDEGYLMFTLPVRSSSLIWSKCLTSLILIVVTGIVCIASVLILAFTKEVRDTFVSQLPAILDPIGVENIGAFLSNLIGSLAVVSVASLFVSIMQAYFSMAVGQLANRHKIGWSIGVFIGFNLIMSSVISSGVEGLSKINFHSPLLNRIFYSALFMKAPTQLQMIQLVWIFFGAIALFNIIEGVILYFVTNSILKNHLNLE